MDRIHGGERIHQEVAQVFVVVIVAAVVIQQGHVVFIFRRQDGRRRRSYRVRGGKDIHIDRNIVVIIILAWNSSIIINVRDLRCWKKVLGGC